MKLSDLSISLDAVSPVPSPTASPPEGEGTWAAVQIRSPQYGVFWLCKREFFRAFMAEHPGEVVYVFPAEAEVFAALGPAARRLAHQVKVETEGFVLPPTHADVVMWEGLPAEDPGGWLFARRPRVPSRQKGKLIVSKGQKAKALGF